MKYEEEKKMAHAAKQERELARQLTKESEGGSSRLVAKAYL